MSLTEIKRIVHHSENDYCKIITHLKLSGNNREIGYRIGELAKEVHGIERPLVQNHLKNQCQKDYLKVNYPIHYERMKGFSEAYGEKLEDTQYDFTCFGHPLKAFGCSAVYYPPSLTALQVGVLSRNLDFPIASLEEIITGETSLNAAPVLSKPYILEIHPDNGYSTLGVLCYELFGLLLDGINSEGLIVTHLHADSINENSYAPAIEYGVGINEMLVVQMLLDNCKNVEEAKMWLWKNKHFYMFVPTHLLIADKSGKSFVWEYSVEHNKEYVIEKNNEINILTNFPLSKYQNDSGFSVGTDESCPFFRYNALHESIRKKTEPISEEEIAGINSSVFFTDAVVIDNEVLPTRTIYHNMYNSKKRSMKISFYCGEENSSNRRTEYIEFAL